MATEYRTSKIKCPKCGKLSSAPIFDSLDLTEASDFTRKMAFSGSLFRFECQSCGSKKPLNYPLSCVDDDMGAIISVLDGKDKQSDYKRIVDVYHSLEQDGDGEIYRIVDTCQELSEKLRIFNDGLDDRVIEILKMFICEDISGSRQNIPKVRCIYKKLSNGSMRFSASYQGEKYEIDLPTSSYLPVEEALEEFDNMTLLNAYIINQQWADRTAGAMEDE